MTTSPDARQNITALQREAEATLRSKSLLQKALWRLAHDPLTLIALAVIILLAVLCFSAPAVVQVLDIEYNNPDLYNSYLPLGAEVSDSNTTTLLLDLETYTVIRPFIGHVQPVLAAAFNADGTEFLSASEDGSVRLWHIPTGRNKRRIVEHAGAVTGVAFSPDDRLFVSASADGTARLWETEKADAMGPDIPLFVLEGHEGGLTSVTFSPDGATVLTGGEDGTARLWDVASGAPGKTLTGHAGAVNAVAFSPDGATILTGSADHSLRVWDAATSTTILTLEGHSGPISSAVFNPPGTLILSGSADHSVRLWDAETGALLRTFEEHSTPINDVAFIPGSELVAATSDDGFTVVWDRETGAVASEMDVAPYPTYGMAVSPDGSSLVVGTEGRRRTYLLGTDGSGRDHATRLLYGGQVSLKIGFFAALGSLTIGIVIGVVAGYFGGVLDDAIIWLITTLNSIPQLFLLLIISAMLAPNETSLILVLVFLGWTGATRIMRGETIALREREFVVAARAIGASNLRIMFVHIAPNVISLLLIVLTQAVGGLILTESSLSFLGFGVKAPTPTWGNMLSGGLEMLRIAPHLVFIPGLLISITVLCLYIVGDGLRDAFDPRLSD